MNHLLVRGNALRLPLADRSVHCCVTSPPYFGLRDYGVKGQIGLEATPEEFVAAMVAVFREVKRVLRDDGTLWLNLGDSYVCAKGQSGGIDPKQPARRHGLRPQDRSMPGVKKKDLIGIPWMVAFALRADGWYLRSDVIWSKPNPMPESIRDRPTKAHEYLFLLSKSPRYYYDHESVKEARSSETLYPGNKDPGKIQGTSEHQGGNSQFRDSKERAWGDLSGRNLRSVWTVATKPFKGAHFATFPPALIVPCVKAGCPPGGVVLDPFGGAFTAAVVAESLGRHSVCTELNPAYVLLGRERLRKAQEAASRPARPRRVPKAARDCPGQTYMFGTPEIPNIPQGLGKP